MSTTGSWNWYLESVAATDPERQIIESFVNDVERSILQLAMDDHPSSNEIVADASPATD